MVFTLLIPAIAEEELQSNHNEVFEVGDYSYNVSVFNDKSIVIVTNKKTQEISNISYDVITNVLNINGDTSSSINRVASRSVRGPFKFYFDVNPSSVGDIVGAVVAIVLFASGLSAAGLSKALVGKSIGSMFGLNGAGDKIFSWFPGASYNGYFTYSQDTKNNGCQARNLNRYLYSRVGYSSAYSIKNFGNGSWFYTSRECVDLY